MIAAWGMAQLLVRNLDEGLVKRLRIRAAEHGLSAEEEHRRILISALTEGEGAKPNFKDHLLGLSEAAPTLTFDRPRGISKRRAFDE